MILTDFNLEFGTGGLRGILGDGSDRMNLYTVGRATQGVANWVLNRIPPESGQSTSSLQQSKPDIGSSVTLVGYDTRRMSKEFAEHTACVLAANGVKVYLFTCPVPTPAVSFAVRQLNCAAGIVITASHNPKEYNGYKVYGSDGGQITLEDAEAISRYILGTIGEVNFIGFDQARSQNMVEYLPASVLYEYLNEVEKLRLTNIPCDNLRVAYTPLHGAGRECVEAIIRQIGAEVVTVPEQSEPDGDFPTCPKPNPEEDSALELGVKLCVTHGCDTLIATDPDCDRVGVAVNHHGAVRRLTGNEVGILLLEYIARTRKENGTMPSRPVAVKTIVTAPMARDICASYGVELHDVLTGFKFIGEQIGQLENVGETERFIFGFEESCGYLSGTHARDKDGVNAAMLVCDMAADYKRSGMTLVDAMEGLYERYGRWTTKLLSFNIARDAVDSLRNSPPSLIAGQRVVKITDYLTGIDGLPSADVLLYTLERGTVIVRPSGTEPKVKVYFLVRGEMDEAIQAETGFAGLFMGRDTP